MKTIKRDERYKKVVKEHQNIRLFTVCTGEDRSVDNMNTESTIKVLKMSGVLFTMARFKERRVFLLADTEENKAIANKYSKQYGTEGFSAK